MAKHGVVYIINNKTRDGENVFKVGETVVIKVQQSTLL
jgi:hypothetical protein